MRNSATFSAILKQLQTNTVGVCGGKAIFNYDGNEGVDKIRKEFAKWTRESDFYDGLNFNTVLKMILNTYVVNGDMVLLFDDGLIEDSGKVLVFESDEIVTTTDKAIQTKFGKNFKQSMGRVYNPNGRFSGVVVSRSQRGMNEADPKMCYFLKRNPDESMFDSLWMMPRNIWRFEQGRGISQATSSLGTILDSEDLTGFELAAAKKNSQTFAQIINTTPQGQEAIPSVFDQTTDFSNMTDEEIEEAVKAEVGQAEEQVITFQKARSAGIIYEQMPDNHKMELLSPNHPNENVMEFVKWLAGRSASVFGLTQQYATLAATGADYKAERLLTEPVFKEGQKFLEQIADWVFYHWVMWADRKGIINKSALGEDFLENISWSWPDPAELDEYSHQMAITLKLQNMTGSYREFYGNDWREKLNQIKDEIQWFKENGLPHPANKLISGGESKAIEVETPDEPKDI